MSGKAPWWKKNIPVKKIPPSVARKMDKAAKYFFLAVLCVFVVWRTVLYFEVRAAFARIHAAGLPASGEELNAWLPKVPDAENGAMVMVKALDLLRTFPDKRSNEISNPDIFLRTNSWTPEKRAVVEEYLKMNSAAVAASSAALMFSKFRYPADFAYGPTTELPHLAGLKKLGQIMRLQATLDAEAGRADQWPLDVEIQLKLARTLDNEPAVISHLVRTVIIHEGVMSTQKCLSQVAPTDEECKKLQADFTEVGESNVFPIALTGQRAMTIPFFRMSWAELQSFPDNDDDESNNLPRAALRYSGKGQWFIWITGFMERDLYFFMTAMEKNLSIATTPRRESLSLTNYFNSVEKSVKNRGYIYSGATLPPLDQVIIREATLRAMTRLASTALAVERFRLAQGRLPENLLELTPQFIDAVPIDPFDGAPLRYRHLAKGYEVYSVNKDGHDDGGREAPAHKKTGDTNSYDWTFIVER